VDISRACIRGKCSECRGRPITGDYCLHYCHVNLENGYCILDPGHQYYIKSYDGGEPQLLTFMKRVGEKYPGNKNAYGGTNCQNVIRVLIRRCEYLNDQIPCWETQQIIEHLRSILFLFEERAKRMRGEQLEISKRGIESYLPCTMCGHILCTQH
jgi:hypothetical protein